MGECAAIQSLLSFRGEYIDSRHRGWEGIEDRRFVYFVSRMRQALIGRGSTKADRLGGDFFRSQ
jgi:hypothetical protein